MPFKTFLTQPVALSGIGTLVGYAGSAVFHFGDSFVVSVALINDGHAFPFQP